MSVTRQKYYSDLLAVLERNHTEPLTKEKARVAYSDSNQIIDSWSHGTVKIHSAVKVLLPSRKLAIDLTLKPEKSENSVREANEYFELLQKDQGVIEEIIGEVLDWRCAPTERQIILNVDADPNNESDWPRQHELLAARLLAFRIAFSSRIAQFP